MRHSHTSLKHITEKHHRNTPLKHTTETHPAKPTFSARLTSLRLRIELIPCLALTPASQTPLTHRNAAVIVRHARQPVSDPRLARFVVGLSIHDLLKIRVAVAAICGEVAGEPRVLGALAGLVALFVKVTLTERRNKTKNRAEIKI